MQKLLLLYNARSRLKCHVEGESTSSLTSAVAVSASTLAEDVRQLAQWCKGADALREQQEGRLEQLNALPSLHAQVRSLSDKVTLLQR